MTTFPKNLPSRADRRMMVQACADSLKTQLEAAADNNTNTEWVVFDHIDNVQPNISYEVRSYGIWQDVEIDDNEDGFGLIGVTHISQETQDFVNAITEALYKQYPMVSIIWSEKAGNWLEFDVSFHPSLDPSYRWWRHESIYN